MNKTDKKQQRMLEKELESLRKQRMDIDFKMRLLRNTLNSLKKK